jgi:hypothetical protein
MWQQKSFKIIIKNTTLWVIETIFKKKCNQLCIVQPLVNIVVEHGFNIKK